MTGQRVLVVDDEPQFLRALQTNLRGAGYDVATATTAAEAVSSAGLQPPEAIILDLLLPDGRGTDVCRELRQWTQAPIIVVSAVGDEAEKITALDAGADDYVTKPFAIGELLARLRAVLRRVGPSTEPVLELGQLVIDLEKRTVTMAGRPVRLTPHEFELLRLLAVNEGKLLTHKTILQRGLGACLPARVELHPRLRLAAPPQAGAGSGAAALHPDGARCGLPPREPRRAFLRTSLGMQPKP